MAELAMLMTVAYIPVDMLIDSRQGAVDPPMVAHHLLGLVSGAIVLSTSTGGCVTMCVHLAECSTPLLHLSWLCIKNGWKTSRPRCFTAVGMSLVALFLVARVAFPVAIIHRMVFGAYREAHLAARRDGSSMLQDACYCTMVSITVMWWVINCFWFVLLLRAALGKRAPDKVDKYN
jgi:hypothetical protein